MSIFSHATLRPNVGLADLSGVAKVFHDLRYRFYPVEFADLCTLIDEIVLREHIVLVGKLETTPTKYLRAIDQLRQAGVFQLLAEAVMPRRVEAPPAELIAAATDASLRGLTRATVTDADLEITRLLGAEAKLRAPATILMRNLHNFGVSRRPRFEHGVTDLVHRNRRLAWDARQLHAEIQRNGPPRRGFTQVDAPPLALAALKRAATFEQLIERILDLRDAHAQLRADTTFLFEQLTNPRTSLTEHAALVRDWEIKWRKSWDGTIATRMYICNTSATLIARGYNIVAALGAPSWAAAFSRAAAIVNDLHEATSLQALRPLHTPVRDYLLSTREQMAAAISRVWEKDPRAIDDLMGQLAGPNSLWRKAFRFERP